jgi:hypothetical protein
MNTKKIFVPAFINLILFSGITFSKDSRNLSKELIYGINEVAYVTPEKFMSVELLKFTLDTVGRSVVINWSTINKTKSNDFIIQRSSDGIRYEDIAKFTVTGEIDRITRYSAIDSNPYYGISYYWLIYTDLNGKTVRSDIRKVRVGESILLAISIDSSHIIHPILLKITPEIRTGISKIIITNASGEEVINAIITKELTDNKSINVPSGIYYFKILDGGRILQSGTFDSR